MATSDEGVRYRDKVTIVTGGAQGIGRACVEAFGKLLFLGFQLFLKFVLNRKPNTYKFAFTTPFYSRRMLNSQRLCAVMRYS